MATALLAAAAVLAMLSTPARGQAGGARLGPSGQTLPRYASLKSDRVSLRSGPGNAHAITWVFRRAGLPVQIVEESDGWRQVRDADGVTGWVLEAVLSARRTALVLPWELKQDRVAPTIELRADDRESAAVVATIEAGVIASIRSCNGRWCEVTVGEYRGHIDQRELWGVDPGEIVR